MRILLYSDLQLHPYKEFAKTVGGVNDRLLDHFHVLDQIYDYAIKRNIKHIFFGGDMFEIRAKVDVVAAKLLLRWKEKVSQAGIQQIDIVGNHDLTDKSTLHNSIELYTQVPHQEVVSRPRWYPVGGYGVLCVPFQHRLEDMKSALLLPPSGIPSIAIVHYGLYEVPMESRSVIRDLGYDTEGQMRISDLDSILTLVKNVFFGHFHITTSVTDMIHFIGTPLQHNWGERSVETRFLDIDLATGQFKPITTYAPRFVEFESYAAIKPELCEGNFCRAVVGNIEEHEKALRLMSDSGARGVLAPVTKTSYKTESRLGLSLQMSFEEMGERLLDADTETKLNKAHLTTVLYELLKEADQHKPGNI